MSFPVSSTLLDAMVLSVVSKEDVYGYKITQDVRTAVDISESTLYPVLRRLQKNNYLEAYDREYNGRNRRYYKVTDNGREQLEIYLTEWDEYKNRIDKVFEGGVDSEES